MVLLVLTALTISCNEVTNVKLVDGPDKGKLNYKIVDDAGKGVAGVKISIYDRRDTYDYLYYDPPIAIDTIRTNQDGIATFGQLVPMDYLLVADTVPANRAKYHLREFVQVVAGIDKTKITKASGFSGILSMKIISGYHYPNPFKNLGVAAVPINPRNINSDNIEDIVNSALIKGITDENGNLSLRIPSNINYNLIFYIPNIGNYGYGGFSYTVNRDEKLQLEFSISL